MSNFRIVGMFCRNMKELIILFLILFCNASVYTQETCIIETTFIENIHERRIPKRKNHRDIRFPQKVTYVFKLQLKQKDSSIFGLIKLQRAYGLLRDFEDNNRTYRLTFDTDSKDEQKRFISNFLNTTLKNGLVVGFDKVGNILDVNNLTPYTPFFDDSLNTIYGKDKPWLDTKLVSVKFDLATIVSHIIAIKNYDAIHNKDTLVPFSPLQTKKVDTSIGIYYNRKFSRPRLKHEDISFTLQDKLNIDTLIVTARTDSSYTVSQKKKNIQKTEITLLGDTNTFLTTTEHAIRFTANKELLLSNYISTVIEKEKVYDLRLFKTSTIEIKVKWL